MNTLKKVKEKQKSCCVGAPSLWRVVGDRYTSARDARTCSSTWALRTGVGGPTRRPSIPCRGLRTTLLGWNCSRRRRRPASSHAPKGPATGATPAALPPIQSPGAARHDSPREASQGRRRRRRRRRRRGGPQRSPPPKQPKSARLPERTRSLYGFEMVNGQPQSARAAARDIAGNGFGGATSRASTCSRGWCAA